MSTPNSFSTLVLQAFNRSKQSGFGIALFRQFFFSYSHAYVMMWMMMMMMMVVVVVGMVSKKWQS